MIEKMKRLWHWMRNPEYPDMGVPFETVVRLRDESYQLGLAQGELQGRMKLAAELEAIYGAADGGGKPCDLEQARKIKARQLH